jgi:hypothetical protein
MGIVYRIDKGIGITYVVWDGMVTDEEFHAHTQRMLADPEWPPAGKKHLIDLTTVDSSDLISVPALQAGIEHWNTLPDRIAGMRIILVAMDGFEDSPVFETMIPAFNPNILVFHTVPMACVWIGIDPAATERVLEGLRAEAQAKQS